MAEEEKKSQLRRALLDSSLIRQTNKKLYNIKVIRCGNDYIQLYNYSEIKIKKDDTYCNLKDDNRVVEKEEKGNTTPTTAKLEEIRVDNALRSKLALERLVKANSKHFKTFITLTFAENVTSIEQANNKFNLWRTKAKKVFPDLMYVCVPEFQKRGAVHYHLITNISLNSNLVALQCAKKNQYDVVYWEEGFSSVFELKDINVVTYMSKYMTKSIDNRLYGRKRYFYSKNLEMPKTEFLNTNDERIMMYLTDLLSNKTVKYSNIYLDKLTKREILFSELTSYNIYYVNF